MRQDRGDLPVATVIAPYVGPLKQPVLQRSADFRAVFEGIDAAHVELIPIFEAVLANALVDGAVGVDRFFPPDHVVTVVRALKTVASVRNSLLGQYATSSVSLSKDALQPTPRSMSSESPTYQC